MHAEHSVEPAFILSNVVTVAGRVRGAWRRTVARGGVLVEVRLLGRMEAAETAAVEEAGRRLGRFLESPVELAMPGVGRSR
jgi:hypothetical protein